MLSLTGVLAFYSKKAEAGSINGNEASVISAAKSTFEYKGRNYVAKSSYIAQLEAKLSSDDVDLTSEQASEAIGTMYANVATGVEEGYLTEVGSSSSGSNADNTDDSNKKDDKDSKDSKDKKDSKDNKDNKDDADSEDNESVELPSESPKSDLNGLEDEMKVIDNNVNELDISGDNYEFVGSVPITTAAVGNKFKINLDKAAASLKLMEQSSDKDINSYFKKNFIKGILPVALVVFLLCIIATIIFIVINREYDIKKIIKQVIGYLITTIGAAIILSSLFINYGFMYSDNFVNKVASTGYYNNVFDTLHDNIDEMLEEAGFEKGDLDAVINERQVYLAGKLNLEAEFNKSRTKDFLNVKNSMYEVLSHKIADNGYLFNQETADKTNNLSGMIQSVYRDSLKFGYAKELIKLNKAYSKKLNIALIIGCVVFLLGISILFLTQKYFHRVSRLTGFAFLSVGFATLMGALYYIVFLKGSGVNISPKLYQNFFVNYATSNSYFLASLGVVALFVGVGLIGVTKMLKEENKLNPFKRI